MPGNAKALASPTIRPRFRPERSSGVPSRWMMRCLTEAQLCGAVASVQGSLVCWLSEGREPTIRPPRMSGASLIDLPFKSLTADEATCQAAHLSY